MYPIHSSTALPVFYNYYKYRNGGLCFNAKILLINIAYHTLRIIDIYRYSLYRYLSVGIIIVVVYMWINNSRGATH